MALCLKDIPNLLPKKKDIAINYRHPIAKSRQKDFDDGYNSALSEISSIPISKILDWAIKNGLVGLDKRKIQEIINEDCIKGKHPEGLATALADSNVEKVKELREAHKKGDPMNNIDKALNKETGNIHPPSYRKGWKAREKLLPTEIEIKLMLGKLLAGFAKHLPKSKTKHDKLMMGCRLIDLTTKAISKRMEG